MLICASYIMVYLHFYFNYRVIFCVYMIRVYRCCAVSSYFESLSLMSVSRSLCYDNKNSAKFVLVSFFSLFFVRVFLLQFTRERVSVAQLVFT